MFSVCRLNRNDTKPLWAALHMFTAYDGHVLNIIDECFDNEEECRRYVDRMNLEVYKHVQSN